MTTPQELRRIRAETDIGKRDQQIDLQIAALHQKLNTVKGSEAIGAIIAKIEELKTQKDQLPLPKTPGHGSISAGTLNDARNRR